MVSPSAFFQTLQQTSADKLLTWVGELYLELHRGTFTTHAATKRGDRVNTTLLLSIETAAALAVLGGGDATRYPRAQLERLWKLLLLNQFHDVLPVRFALFLKQVLNFPVVLGFVHPRRF